MKLPAYYSDMCFKQVFVNATSGRNSSCLSVVNSACYQLQLPLTVPVPAVSTSRRETCDARFTDGRLQKLRNHRNSATSESRTNNGINFFYYKDLGYHILQ
jgi:hypothetical protein